MLKLVSISRAVGPEVHITLLSEHVKETKHKLLWTSAHTTVDHQHTTNTPPHTHPTRSPSLVWVRQLGEAICWTENNDDQSNWNGITIERRQSCCNIPILQLTRWPSLFTPTRSQSSSQPQRCSVFIVFFPVRGFHEQWALRSGLHSAHSFVHSLICHTQTHLKQQLIR